MTKPAFHKQFLRTGTPNLLRQFGEPITYHTTGGTQREIDRALVDRTNAPKLIVRVRNASVGGISSSEIDTGGDEISVPLRIGETAVRRSVIELIDDSNGFTRFVVE